MENKVPYIIGTTASPLNEPSLKHEDAYYAIMKLCIDMDSKFA